MKTEKSSKTIEKQGSVTRRGGHRNRVIALVLSVVLAVCLVPVVGKTEEVHATETETMWLGSEQLNNNYVNMNLADYVWYGYDETNIDKERYSWRVVGYNGEQNSALSVSGELTLFATGNIKTGVQFNSAENHNAKYSGSNLQREVNNIAEQLSSAEKEAIGGRTLIGYNSVEDANYIEMYGDSVLNARMWPLSGREYNSCSASIQKLNQKYEYNRYTWWIRTPENIAACNYKVFALVPNEIGDNSILAKDVTESHAIRPAFYVNLSSIVFTSLIKLRDSDTGQGEYKLTLLDSAQTFSIPRDKTLIRKSTNEVTIPYIIDNTKTDHISLLITNKDDTWTAGTGWSANAAKKYYQTVAVSSAAASVTFTLPDNYEENRANWKVWVLPEQINGLKETNYAGTPQEINIPYKVVFATNEGTGTMDPQNVCVGDIFKFPECSFEALSNRVFDHWKISGEDGIHYPGGTVLIAPSCALNGVITVTALWKNHSHNWTYSASGETITASCSGAGTCDITTGLKLTISAPSAETLTYDGTAKAATLNTDYNTTAFSGENTISYYKGTSALSGAPVDAGKYKATVSIGTETAEVSYEINKADPVVIVAPIASDITYGEALSSSTISGGNVTASVSGESTNIAGIFSWETGNVEPTVADSGTTDYAALFTPADPVNFKPTTVNLKLAVAPKELTVTGITAKDKVYDGNDTAELDLEDVVITGLLDRDKNKVSVTAKGKFENADAGKNKKVTISDLKLTGDAASNYVLAGTGNQTEAAAEIFRLDSRIKEIPVAKTGLVYTGSKQELITKGTAENGTLVYALTEKGTDAPDDTRYSTDIPTAIEAGTYTVYYKVTGGINYNDAPVVKLDVDIKKASQEAPVLTSTDETESGKNDGTITGLTTAMEISANGKDNDYHPVTEATITGAQYAPGTYYVRYAGDKNHEPSEPYVITIKKGADPDDDDYYIPSYPDYIPPKNDKKESKFTPGIKKTVTENIDGSVTTVTIVTGFDGRVTETTVTEWPSGKKDTKEVVTDRDGNVLSVMTEKVRFNKKKQTKTVTTVIEKADGYSIESVETTYVSGKVVKVTTEITPKKTKKYIKETKKKDGSVTTESVETKVDGKTTLKSTAKGTDDIETVKIYAVKEDGTVRLESLITGKKTAIVPATVTFNGVTYVVNSIARGAFEGNTTLKTVKIGLNILYIRSGAFEGAENLKNIYMDVTNLKKVFVGAFDGISPKAKFTLTAPDKKTFRRARKKLWNSGVPKNMPIKSGK